MSLFAEFWKEASETGERKVWLAVWYYLAFAMFKGALFTILLVVAKGWMIMRPMLDPSDRRTLMLTVCWLMVAMFTYQLFSGLFLFALILVYVVVLRIIFANISHHARVLRVQHTMLSNSNPGSPAIQGVKNKLLLFKGFQVMMVGYVVTQVVLRILSAFLTTQENGYWIYVVIEESMDWVLFAIVVGTLRFRLWRRGGLEWDDTDELMDPLGFGMDTTEMHRRMEAAACLQDLENSSS